MVLFFPTISLFEIFSLILFSFYSFLFIYIFYQAERPCTAEGAKSLDLKTLRKIYASLSKNLPYHGSLGHCPYIPSFCFMDKSGVSYYARLQPQWANGVGHLTSALSAYYNGFS
jgi:hypothetical protein